jgi:hypothetical protein
MAMMLELLALIFSMAGASSQDAFDPLKYVDPLIGSLNGGTSTLQRLG